MREFFRSPSGSHWLARTACLAVSLIPCAWAVQDDELPEILIPHTQVQVADRSTPPNEMDAAIALAPYWIHIGTTQAKLAWRTAVPRAVGLRLLDLDSGVSKSFSVGEAAQQSFEFTGLRPDSQYQWELSTGHKGIITTMPVDKERTFAVIGRTHGTEHFGAYSDNLLAGHLVQAAPQFVIHTGNCVYYSEPKNWKRHYFQVFEELVKKTPVYISPGNHDSGWPFVDGLELRPFRSLFEYPYPKAVGSGPEFAFYDLVQGPIHFIFLSYVSNLSLGSAQGRWLNDTLDQSHHPFRIVVYGGLDQYFDRNALLDFLGEKRVDAIFNGDGGAPPEAFHRIGKLPVFTVGSAFQAPQPWLLADVNPQRLVIREMNSMGASRKAHWIYTAKRHEAVTYLPDPVIQYDQKGLILSYSLAVPISSKNINGIQFNLEGMDDHLGYFYVSTNPTDTLVDHQGGFPSQFSLIEKKDHLVSAPISNMRPIRGGEYQIQKVVVRMIVGGDKSAIKVSKAYLY